jgi:hypothetical protein
MATAAVNSLVSYSAPAADSTTFFVDNLTGTATASIAGLFAGAGTQQDEVSYGFITTVKNVSAADASTWFGFHTLTENAGTNSTGNDIVGVDTGVVPAFTSINSDVATQGSLSPIETEYFRIQRDFLDTLSDHVFGHRDSADLFSNQEAVKDAWDTAEAAAVTNANASMNTSGGADENTSINASKELVEALLVSNSARFSLGYTATINGPFTAETTSGLDVVVSQGGTPTIVAKANVVMSAAESSTIKSIVIASDVTPGTVSFTLTETHATQLNGTAGGTDIAIDDPVPATTNFVPGTTEGLSVLPSTGDSGGSGAGAIVTVIASDATTLTSITITGTGSGYAVGDVIVIGDLSTALNQETGDLTGAGYTLGDTITITDSDSGNIITISAINHVQVAILNGTLAGSSNTTNPPLEIGDKIRLKFGILSATSQKNASNVAIDFRQSYYIDYQLQ